MRAFFVYGIFIFILCAVLSITPIFVLKTIKMRELIVSNKQLPSIREGVSKGLEIASGAKSSATYYHKREDQVAAVQGSINTLYAIGKELPLILAAQRGVTGFFLQEVLLNEFAKGERGGACNIVNPQVWYDDGLGSKLTEHLIYVLDRDNGLPYVLRMFEAMRARKINNQRSRKMALRFILSHNNLDYVSVKYRKKLKNALVHIYGKKKVSALVHICRMYVEQNMFSGEPAARMFNTNFAKFANSKGRAARAFLFIMGAGDERYYDPEKFPVISSFYRAGRDISGCSLLPVEVLEGIISKKSHPQFSDKWSTEAKRKLTQKQIRDAAQSTTANQAMRQTKKNQQLGVTKSANVEGVTDFLALYKTGYEAGFTPEIRNAITKLAEKRKFTNFMYGKIGVVVDKSMSMTGHKQESKNTPRAIASFTAEVLSKSAECSIKTTHSGAGTDIAEAFVDLVSDGEYQAIFVISDGYENSYDGLFNEVVSEWRKSTGTHVPIYHVSPVTGSEVGAKVRSFGQQVSTIAVNKPDSLSLQLSTKLLEQDIVAWLGMQVRSLSEVKIPTRRKAEGATVDATDTDDTGTGDYGITPLL